MKELKIIIYGTGVLGRELAKQVDCYNRIAEEKMQGSIKILSYTESVYRGGFIGNIPVIALEECHRLPYDYIVIASSYIDEIRNTIEEKGILDLTKVVTKDEFCPQNNGLNLSQFNTGYYYNKKIQSRENPELEILYKEFINKDKFIDILNRRRFIEKKEEIEKYCNLEIFYDSEEELKYVLYNGKKLYYPAEWNNQKIIEYHALNVYTCMSETSAHRYLDSDFDVYEKDVVADIGAAEGLFSLHIVDKVKRIYLFEADKAWIKPLCATFKPYREKVVIENKYVSNINIWEFVTLDDYFEDKEISLIKMDIEGDEQKALLGCKNILKRKDMRWLITTYHRSEDMEFIDAFMKINGYITERVENWLWIDQVNLNVRLFGEFRKAMLRGKKIEDL